ncbi:transposase [Paracoccus aerodenitrificans]|uniref:transposase n=1 Tax=Paracoccus aerodenitrificans TaxID=3017781 RepID=UPI003EBC92B2
MPIDKQVLVPELEPGTVVILDNLATHKNAAAAKAMRKAGCWFLFLPPYSPDLTRSRWHSPNSRHTCAGSVRGPSPTCSTLSRKSNISFRYLFSGCR